MLGMNTFGLFQKQTLTFSILEKKRDFQHQWCTFISIQIPKTNTNKTK